VVVSMASPVVGQPPELEWNAQLVGRPLYLRGCWLANKLAFDGTGMLLGNSPVGPFTLSGVEVTSAAIEGHSLVIHGNRVALVAKSDGKQGLERRAISSMTQIMPSLRRGDKNKFYASEEMRITVQPDPMGNFDGALAKIFADGLAELSASVPIYWKCYAASYFAPAVVSDDAEEKVEQCVSTPRDSSGNTEDGESAFNVGGSILPPTMTVQTPPRYSGIAGGMGIGGTAVVHIRIGTDGIPAGLQVVRAVGGGLDEEALQAASQDRFKPATRAGVAVPVNVNIDFRFAARQ
jgi:TonB family protein